LQFYEVVEVGCQSKRKYEHFGIGLQKLHHELLTMDEDSDKDINDGDVGSAEDLTLNNQVLSNLTFTLEDPLHVSCIKLPFTRRNNVFTKKKKIHFDLICIKILFSIGIL